MLERVVVRHPGYQGVNDLLELPACDGANRNCVHYLTVKVACSILTDVYDGTWLSKFVDGSGPVGGDSAGLLPAGNYYLHVPQRESSGTEPYAVVPNFREWRYPHESLPVIWRRASETETQREHELREPPSTERCRIQNKQLACEQAHIIPRSELTWFAANGMHRYGPQSERRGVMVAETSVNKMRLTASAHRLWDTNNFSIVPREVPNTDPPRAAWFTQILRGHDELEQDWHRKETQSLADRAPEYLFARFAWDIFPMLHGFLQAGQRRHLTIWSSDGTRTTRMFDPSECFDFTVGQGRSRSASPQKRMRSETGSVGDDAWVEPDDHFHAYSRSQSRSEHGDDRKRRRVNSPNPYKDEQSRYRTTHHWGNGVSDISDDFSDFLANPYAGQRGRKRTRI